MDSEQKILVFDERKRTELLDENPEIYFRALARRYRLIGAWAAEKMFLFGEKADLYIADFLGNALHFHDLSEAINRCEKDFTKAEIAFTRSEVIEKFYLLIAEAEAQIRKEPPEMPEPSS